MSARVVRLLAGMLLAVLGLFPAAATAGEINVPILAYHRFGPVAVDSMTVSNRVFASHLHWLKENGYTVIPLRALVQALRGDAPAPPAKSVVITIDDAHQSVYTDILPLVKSYQVPVTLFVYPSAVSNAAYAMTWDELQQLKATGLFDLQSHTYWHPNFNQERKKLTPEAYRRLVATQLQKSRATLEKRCGGTVDLLAWPFGIYDAELEEAAGRAGYVAAFSIDRRHANRREKVFAQPRYLVVDGDNPGRFARLVGGGAQGHGQRAY